MLDDFDELVMTEVADNTGAVRGQSRDKGRCPPTPEVPAESDRPHREGHSAAKITDKGR